MEESSDTQDQAGFVPAPVSLSASDASSNSNTQVTNMTESTSGEQPQRNHDTYHEITFEEDKKPSLSQGMSIVVNIEPGANDPGDDPSEHTLSQENADDMEQYVTPIEGPRSSSTAPPTPPSKYESHYTNHTQVEGSVGRDSSDAGPPTPVEKSNIGQRNGIHIASPRTPTTPLSPASHKRSLTISKGHTVSVVLISSALETILSSREAKRSAELRDSAQHALEMVRSGQGGDQPREIFEPLRLACETRNEKLMIASLDCISKLISYSFFAETPSVHPLPSPPPSPGPQTPGASSSHSHTQSPSLVDLVAHTITACHNETTPETVSLQIVKALLSLVLSPTILVHQSSLLKAVRTVYNVFLLSADPVNQTVAQGGLTQMVHHVFTRCKNGRGTDVSDVTGLFRAAASEESVMASSRRGSLTPLHPEARSSNHESRIASHREVEAVLNPMNESTASLPVNPEESSVSNDAQPDEVSSEAPKSALCVHFIWFAHTFA